MRLAEPGWLWLLALAPLPWLWARRSPALTWPSTAGYGFVGRRSAALRACLRPAARGLAVAGLVLALARPQTLGGWTRVAGQGVAVVVALDQSSSMNTADFSGGLYGPARTRLGAARKTLARFVAGRPDDLLGLVVFANYPDTACPPTLDHEFLLDAVRAVRSARPGDDGTNLGDALVWALDALKDAPTRKKVIVLLTDGRNSPAVPHPTDPLRAAAIARGLGVRVHTVAVGRGGSRVQGVEPQTGLPVTAGVEGPDLELLSKVAAAGGGLPFVADEADALSRVFSEIDALETSPVRGAIRTRYRERFTVPAVVALGLLLADRWLAWGRLRRLP